MMSCGIMGILTALVLVEMGRLAFEGLEPIRGSGRMMGCGRLFCRATRLAATVTQSPGRASRTFRRRFFLSHRQAQGHVYPVRSSKRCRQNRWMFNVGFKPPTRARIHSKPDDAALPFYIPLTLQPWAVSSCIVKSNSVHQNQTSATATVYSQTVTSDVLDGCRYSHTVSERDKPSDFYRNRQNPRGPACYVIQWILTGIRSWVLGCQCHPWIIPPTRRVTLS